PFARDRQAAGGSRGLSGKGAGLEDGVGVVPLHQAKGRRGGDRTELQTGGKLFAYVVGVASLGNLVDQKLHCREAKIFYEWSGEIPRYLFAEAFGIEIVVEGLRTTNPGVGELAAG